MTLMVSIATFLLNDTMLHEHDTMAQVAPTFYSFFGGGHTWSTTTPTPSLRTVRTHTHRRFRVLYVRFLHIIIFYAS